MQEYVRVESRSITDTPRVALASAMFVLQMAVRIRVESHKRAWVHERAWNNSNILSP